MAFIPFPAGTVLAYAGATAPSGWLMCDGSAYSQADYPDAYAVLGVTYNTQTNPTTGSAYGAPSAGQFRVPDYRGIFLRAVGTASGKDATSLGGYQTEKTNRPASAFTATAAAQTFTGGSNSGTVGGADGTHTHGTGYADSNAATGGESNLLTFHRSNSSNILGPRTDAGTIVKSNNSGHGHGFSLTASGTNAASAVGSFSGGDNETRPLNRGVNYIIKI